MLDFIFRRFKSSRRGVPTESNDNDANVRPIRRQIYRERLDLTNKPLIMLSGASIESARELIPFLRSASEMETTMMSCDEIIAYNGEEADEIHVFSNVKQAGSKLSRILQQFPVTGTFGLKMPRLGTIDTAT
jgi:hypothetical protein